MQIEQSIQPESIRKLLSRSLTLYKATFLRVLYLGLLLSIVTFIPRLIYVLGHDGLAKIPLNSPQRLWFVLIELVTLALFTAILWRMRCKSLGIHEGVFVDLKIAIKKLPFIFMAAVIQSFIITVISLSLFMLFFFIHRQQALMPQGVFIFITTVMSLLQIGIAMFLLVSFYFYLPIILTEDKRVFGALKQSVYLVWGNWWNTLKLQATPWLVYLVCLFAIRYGIHVNLNIYFIKTLDGFRLSGTILHIILFALFIPWIAATQLVQLRDLELRKKVSTPA